MQFITLDNIKRFFENITKKALVFSGKVQFDNQTIFNENTEFNKQVDFNGNSVEINCDANMNRPIVMNETVEVHGEQTNNSKVIMNGGIQVNSIVNKVSTTLLDMGEGQSITYKGEELATKDQITDLQNDLQEGLKDKLSLSDGGTIDGDTTFTENNYTIFKGEVQFNKTVDFNGTDAINFNGEVDFNKNANVGGTLTANSNAVFNDGITVKQSTDGGKTFTTLLNTDSGIVSYKGNELATKKIYLLFLLLLCPAIRLLLVQ